MILLLAKTHMDPGFGTLNDCFPLAAPVVFECSSSGAVWIFSLETATPVHPTTED